jgi:hypothetical protein
MKNPNTFYKQLGNLFYAIAAADKKISPEERDSLHKEIQYGWKHFDESTDRFGSDRAFVIQYEFDTMEDAFESSEEAFRAFSDYFRENEKEFDSASRKRIFNSARHIAESVRRINTPELDYLVRLKQLLKV